MQTFYQEILQIKNIKKLLLKKNNMRYPTKHLYDRYKRNAQICIASLLYLQYFRV